MKKLFLRNIKKGFATNSSSYHSTLILTDEEYQKWNSDTLFVKDEYINKEKYSVTKEEIKELFSMDELKEMLEIDDDNKVNETLENMDEDGALDELLEDYFEAWYDDELETDEEKYVTPSGEVIHILCKYGN